MTASTGADRTTTTATTGELLPSGLSASLSQPGDRAPQRTSDAMRSRSYLVLSATCAILVPITVFAIVRLTNDGPVRMLLTWAIPLLMGSAVYASAVATDIARRRR